MSLPDLEHLQTAALQQPGAVRRHAGIKFQCPQCAAEGHDEHLDNACLFNDGRWGCAWATDIEAGRAHRRAIGQVLGAVTNGRVRAETAPPAASAGEDLGLMSIGELLGESDTAPAWLVDQRLPAGGLGILPGKPKAGKTTLARWLTLSVARGEPWLGHATTRGPVIYLALEEKRSEVRAHFKALGATSTDPIFILCATAPVDALARLRREAERRRPVLIIIDPLFRFVRVPAELGNDYSAMTALLEPLLVLARETGAHVLVVHHLGKGERGDGDAILGSTAIFAAVDTALLMKRTERYRTLSSIQRYGEDLQEITLVLDPVTRNITAGLPRAEAEDAEAAA